MPQFTWPEQPDEAHNHASPDKPIGADELADSGAALTAPEQAVERTLLADGAAWRRHVAPTLPGVDDFVARAAQRLTAERASTRTSTRASTAARPIDAMRTRQPVIEAPQRTPLLPPSLPSMNRGPLQKGTYPVTQSRWRGLAGVAVALIVVGIVGLLLAHSFGGRGAHSQTGAGATATASTAGTSTPTPYSNAGTTSNIPYPVIAPSNPQIVYFAQNAAIGRSTDGGKTYTAVTTPPTTLKNVTFVVSVSPLDANHLIATGTGDRNTDNTCPAASGQAAGADKSVRTRKLAMLSGFAPCSQSFFSADGGKTWRYLALSYNDVIGSLAYFHTLGTGLFPPSTTLLAQGTRLYAAIGQAAEYGALESGVGSHPVEIVVSADDGATWQIASNGLNSTNICDFASAPIGQTVYAVASTQGCANEVPSPLTLWRSDDAGASWSQVSNLPTDNELGMAASASGAVYINMPQGGPTADRGFTLNQSPEAMIVSTDGGATFTHAPIAGVSGFGANDTFAGPVGVLSNGSILALAVHYDGQTAHNSLYSWQANAGAWVKVGATPDGIVELVVVPQGGRDTLYLVNGNGQISRLTV